MSKFTHPKNRRLTALLFCLLLAVLGCTQGVQKSMPDTPQAGKIIEQANNSKAFHAPDGQALLGALSANAFRCYTLNNCRGNYTPDVATAKACIDLGGNSWTDRNGACVSDIGE
jgi:hypothetical protein